MPRDLAAVQKLCWDYRDYLWAFDDGMRHIVNLYYPLDVYTALMDDLPVKHARPRGAIYVSEYKGLLEGCGMYHPLSEQDCEIKRVFVRENLRGMGAGESLSLALIEQARADGYKRILLDTRSAFTGARKLYEKLGFSERGPYSDTPPDAVRNMSFYELTL